MLALMTGVLPIVKSSCKIILTAVVVFGMLYLSYDYGFKTSTNKYTQPEELVQPMGEKLAVK